MQCRLARGSGRALLLAAAALAVAGCGEKKQADGGTVTSLEDAGAAELTRFQAEENARSRVTLVDAATGDATGMPAEWTGPTAYDLRATEADDKREEAKREKEDADAALAPPAVVEEVLPSVAE